ncbi:pituitary tumor-transforming gene 1 protein-interacting protein-like isoform X2 [Clavelina lepadiformis]|uniref:Pituitary tumor-transforming gene 1 protein-interacting protein-like n=1 Tax=Clavelina lepadiformis TaxID=159417 RepID=A0ABP0EZX8_CLALP
MKFGSVLCTFMFCMLYFCKAESSTTTPSQPCHMLNESCQACLKNVSCLWCNNPKKCLDYPVKHVIPNNADCSLSAARWGVCWLNFEAMIISVSVIGGVLLIGITLCFCKCCGCCCFKKDSSKYLAEQARLDRERQERSMRQDERKQDRQRRNDEIRRKYGLVRDNGYQRFQDESA